MHVSFCARSMALYIRGKSLFLRFSSSNFRRKFSISACSESMSIAGSMAGLGLRLTAGDAASIRMVAAMKQSKIRGTTEILGGGEGEGGVENVTRATENQCKSSDRLRCHGPPHGYFKPVHADSLKIHRPITTRKIHHPKKSTKKKQTRKITQSQIVLKDRFLQRDEYCCTIPASVQCFLFSSDAQQPLTIQTGGIEEREKLS